MADFLPKVRMADLWQETWRARAEWRAGRAYFASDVAVGDLKHGIGALPGLRAGPLELDPRSGGTDPTRLGAG